MKKDFLDKVETAMNYTLAALAGMCFEYSYRVDSEVWFIPFSIAILSSLLLIVGLFK